MILPRRIYDLGLSHKAVSVYCYLCGRADKNGECYPSVGRIAEDLNLSTCTVFRAFNELEKHDLLERFPRYHTQGGQRSSLYRIKGEITKTNRSEKRGKVTNVTSKKGGDQCHLEKGGDMNV